MKFLWPEILWLLLLLPALVAGYLYLMRHKRQVALRYSSLSMIKNRMGTEQKYRRHIAPLLFLLALTALLLASARPAAVVTWRLSDGRSFSPWMCLAAWAPLT
jgi:Ca-activated chloride channel homolog